MFMVACSVLSRAHAVPERQLGPVERESRLGPDGLCVSAGSVPPPSRGVLIWDLGRILSQRVISKVELEQLVM